MLVAVSLIGLLAVACDGNGAEVSSPSTTGGGASTPTSAPAGPTTTVTLPNAATTATSVPGLGPAGVAHLTALRAARQPGFDRVVFEFEGPTVPPARVEYVNRPIRQDGSGNEVTVAGAAVLTVRMFPASGVDLTGATLRQVYTGRDRIDPADTQVVEELVRTGDFEAVLTWAVGVKRQAPFLVTTLAGPSRLVVDIQG